jgi:retron-type reverse transcriptase
LSSDTRGCLRTGNGLRLRQLSGDQDDKSPVTGDGYAGICGSPGLKCPGPPDRPNRRAHDAVAEVRHFTSHSYEWIVEGDIKACFDEISHSGLLARVRDRVGDKRVLSLVKAFLKAGILGEDRVLRENNAGTPQGSILSPLLSNVALTVLDEFIAHHPGGPGAGKLEREKRRRRGLPNIRLVRFADLCRARHKSAYADSRVMPRGRCCCR